MDITNQPISREEYKSLEHRVTHLESRQARAETRLDGIEKKLDKIDSNTTYILRIIVSAIIISILSLVLKGGGMI